MMEDTGKRTKPERHLGKRLKLAWNSRQGRLLHFFLRKFRDVAATLLLMSLLVFLVFYIIPGDPITMMLGTDARPEKRAALEEELQLHQPPLLRYWHSVEGLWNHRQPSLSLRFQKPVAGLIASRLGVTMTLAILAFLIVLILCFPLAILASRRAGGWLDRLLSMGTHFFMAIPGFFLGILLILLFAFILKLVRPGYFVPLRQGFWPYLGSLFLPALAVALPKLSQAVQFLRSSLLESKNEDYVRTARSKGASEARVLFHHRLRNSLLPLVTTLGLILAELMTGSLVVEQVFVLPGIGRLLFTAIEARDLPLAQGIILTIAFIVVMINLLCDLISRLIDPRLDSAAATGGREEAGDV